MTEEATTPEAPARRRAGRGSGTIRVAPSTAKYRSLKHRFAPTPMVSEDELEAIHNASLVVFPHGAEIGPVWLGLAEGACASLIFPYLCEETLAWWVGGPLGLRIAPFYEAPVKAGDERFALPAASADDIIAIYNRDLRVEPRRLENTLWCADARGHW